MKLIVGLGNPGKRYENNRHNVGCLVIGELRKVNDWSEEVYHSFKSYKLYELSKEPIFMNIAGQAIAPLLKKKNLDPAHLLVIHDDLDLGLGEFKPPALAKGPRGHNGIISIEEMVGSKDFYRLRVGIDNRAGSDVRGEDYVLSNFMSQEKEILSDLIREKIVPSIKDWLLET